MRRLFNIVKVVLAAASGTIFLLLLTAYLLEYRPQNFEQLELNYPTSNASDEPSQGGSIAGLGTSTTTSNSSDKLSQTSGTAQTPHPSALTSNSADTVSILCWNIGYCGLSKDMDFFLDGGTRTRTSEQATRQNLEQIIATIQAVDADIVLLQEVDKRAFRSYNIDQHKAIMAACPQYYSFFAYNFKTRFVPIPVGAPLGRVEAGIMTLSKFKPKDITRISYPVAAKLPSRMFDLKRALTLCKVVIGGDTIIIGNTHNSAYDNGTARKRENDLLSELLSVGPYSQHKSLVGGDWNQLPPDYKLASEAAADPCYTPIEVDPQFLADTHEWVADTSKPSMRYLDKPYSDGCKVAITDFFLAPKASQVVSIETLDCGFSHSDHQPVLLKIVF